MGLKILFEDEHIMVVKKDAGIPVQAGKLRMMEVLWNMKWNMLFTNKDVHLVRHICIH